MTESSSGPRHAAPPVAALVVPALPNPEQQVAEVDNDRRHERFLVRAAVIATLLVAAVIWTRLWFL